MKSENKKALLRLLMKDLAPQLLLFAAELVLIVLVSSLYQVEREAVLYTCGLCLLLQLGAAALHLNHQLRSHAQRQQLRSTVAWDCDRLPQPCTLIQQDDREMIENLAAQVRELTDQLQNQRRESLDYYTTWVHQIKTPIAALHMLLEGEDTEEHRAMAAELFRILLFYTSRFLMRQRRREFGLYNVLGMEKRHVGRVLFFETVFSALCSILPGLALGVVLYKLCSLLICRIFQVESVLGFDYLRPFPLLAAALFFGGVYLLTYAFDLIQIARLKPVELLHSTQTGEREPKVQWLVLVAGLLTLGAGYFIAVTTKSPLKAMNYFFIAVMLVIVGTYCLFFTGTTALLRLLKRRRGFYYQKGHMVAVSGLLYRMRQNAVGLASITILATGVLVMVSTTVSLYAGIAGTLERQFPHPMHFDFSYSTTGGGIKNLPFEVQAGFAQKAAEETGLTISFLEEETHIVCSYRHRDGALELRDKDEDYTEDTCSVFFLTAQEYEKLTGESLKLAGNECAVYTMPGSGRNLEDSFTLTGQQFTVTKRLSAFPADMGSYSLLDSFGVVVSDKDVFQRICQEQKDAYGAEAVEPVNHILLDFTDREQAGQVYRRFWMSMGDQMQAYVEAQPDAEGGWGSASDSVWDAAEELYGLDGTLLFLGLILTVVFLFATALILYYKQITEGLDDWERYQILQKVGMSRQEVHKTIHSQLLLVIALPLAVSAVHISVAFPMLTKLLRILLNGDAKLFLLCTVGAFGAFTVVYLGLYWATARVYEGIVR